MRVLDLFSGIGGFSLGLERAGMRTVAFCEIDPFCQRVLHKHWPNIPCYEDVTKLRMPAGFADVVCGGFPCQDISVAGKGAGLSGERSGLWREFARVIGEVRPSYVIVENVSGLLARGLGELLGDLATLGFDAEWHCIPAAALGAPHQRDRVWIIAYAHGHGLQERVNVSWPSSETAGSEQSRGAAVGVSASQDAADTERRKRSLGWPIGRVGGFYKSVPRDGDWPVTSEPVLDRGADGIPDRLDRLRALGNAVVPQIPELIGRAIMRAASNVSVAPHNES